MFRAVSVREGVSGARTTQLHMDGPRRVGAQLGRRRHQRVAGRDLLRWALVAVESHIVLHALRFAAQSVQPWAMMGVWVDVGLTNCLKTHITARLLCS